MDIPYMKDLWILRLAFDPIQGALIQGTDKGQSQPQACSQNVCLLQAAYGYYGAWFAPSGVILAVLHI